MNALVSKYRLTLLNLFCVAVNIPFALTGHVLNIFVCGWCSAFAIASFSGERQ